MILAIPYERLMIYPLVVVRMIFPADVRRKMIPPELLMILDPDI